jgi:hypothetical protein
MLKGRGKQVAKVRAPAIGIDAELEEYRRMMDVPKEFEEGFTLKTVIGALFVAFVFLPGSIYLWLVAGHTLGAAAQWVTVILFVEVARRSFMVLRRQEVYLLVVVASALIGTNPFQGFIWNVYLRTSHVTKGLGIADEIPTWVVPPADSPAIIHRTFFHPHWVVPILLMLFGSTVGQVKGFSFGYLLFRITSDYERLPFPLAPVGALSATALAEITTKEETWRWRIFSIGAMIGLAWGIFYVGIPTLTGALMTRPLQLIKIPFIELTHNTQNVLPATPTGIGTDLGSFLYGFVAPFWSVTGGFIAALLTLILNPILYYKGFLKQWRPGMDTIQTQTVNHYDFWLSASIGVSLAVATLGIASVISSALKVGRTTERRERGSFTPPPGRGDFPIPVMLLAYIGAAIAYVILCHHLIPHFYVWFLLLFAFVYTPLTSYVDARMIGLTGQWITIPYVREATFILYSKLTGYKGIDIWFAPIPIADYGGAAQHWRIVELTGTKFTSLLKAVILVICIAIPSNLAVWQIIWRLAPIPSSVYPYAQKMWPLQAFYASLWWTATAKGKQALLQAVKFPVIAIFFASSIAAYGILYAFQLPILLIYGFIRGMSGMLPHYIFVEFAGALVRRFYIEKRIDPETWRRYAAVLLGGYSCGMGLVGMFCAAVAIVSKAVSQLPY